jgi:SAM-dependent methyltransferase
VSGEATFDAYARDYEEALEQGIRLSGEDSAWFAGERVAWTGRRLRELCATVRTVLDFGCGTGSTTPHLLALPGVERIIGTDVSEGLLEVARREHRSEHATFVARGELLEEQVDLAYCNGVFHHIPPNERPASVAYVRRALRPGGWFALWENNPWNPGTRLVMRRIPFDRDAVTLTARETRRMLEAGGFEVARTDFRFVFPRPLRALRRLEPRLARLPLGAQCMVLARRPDATH